MPASTRFSAFSATLLSSTRPPGISDGASPSSATGVTAPSRNLRAMRRRRSVRHAASSWLASSSANDALCELLK
ncbi:hypothetical protein ATCC90586_011136 [Pythium insidiosum]|nr:hypothetical protein ATCC90586_011136 [Pythium insidiosum]